jgi:hypothetical protein
VVRVVHSLFTSSDQWDDQLEGFESGWPGFFRILRLYLAHFRGLPCTSFRIMGSVPETESVTWDATGTVSSTFFRLFRCLPPEVYYLHGSS